jgi:DNA-binding MarR family transcriptional regulator
MVLIAQDSSHYRLHDLAEHLNIEAPSVTRKVQQLEKAGLIARHQDDKDKRAYDVKATKRGLEVAMKIRDAQRQITSQVLNDWTQQERETFVNLFERFCKGTAEIYNPKLDKTYNF